MPWGNGTGPSGYGPMTGRAAGFCAGYQTPGYSNPILGRGLRGGAYYGAPIPLNTQWIGPYGPAGIYGGFGRPFGLGRGFGFGRGFGRGRGRGWYGRGRGRFAYGW